MFPARRIEDRIRDLCGRVASATSDHEVAEILAELQTTIHEYTRRCENQISATVLSWRYAPPERRRA